MDHDGRVEPQAIEPAFRRIIAAYPDAGVAAVGPNGLFCAMPPQVELTSQHRLQGRAGIDLVAAESRAVVLEQFRQLTDRGAIEVEVRLAAGNPGRYALFDTRDAYGVVMLVVIEGEADGSQQPAVILAGMAPLRPRYGRVKRTEVSGLIDVDEATLGMLRYSRDEFSTLDAATTLHPDDYPAVVGQWFDLLTAPPGSSRRSRARYRCGDGSWLWVEITVTQHLDDPVQPHMISELVDISEEMEAMDEVWQSRELLHRLTEALPIGVLQIDSSCRVVYANDRLHRIVGVPRADTLSAQLASIIDDDRDALEQAVEEVLTTGADLDREYRFRLGRSHALRYSQMAFRALRDRFASVTGAIICVTDVTESTRMRKELEMRASFDVLTQCFNRATVMAEIERALEGGAPGTALVFVDLDAFKPVNDRLGHAAGDELLKSVAAALQQAVRAHDVVGRLGGDEFVVLCPDVATRAQALEIGERIARAVGFDAPVGGELVRVRASVGVAWAAQSGSSAEALVAAADDAMYESKRAGVNLPVLAAVR
jgi:diguanylate cyclase (GGDEF)-like protein/PAS domain S-box-containing protein